MSLGARLVCAAVVVLPGLDVSTNARLGFSCARETESLAVTPATPPKPTTASVAVAPPPPVKPALPPPETPASWLAKQVPDGGKVVNDGPNLSVQHTAKEGETLLQLSAKYIDLTDFFSEGQLLHALEKQNPKARGKLAAGTTVTIPGIVQAIPKTGAEARLGWPKEDGGSLRGIYANAWMAGLPTFPALLDQVAQKGMNALVLDAKDVTGQFTYPSKIPLAVEIGASKHATLPSFARVVRFAHARGIRVVARVSCFRDEWLGPRKGELAVQKKGGGPHVAPSKIVDWLDPTNEKVQQYLLDVIDESLEAGVDEIQLDYVRYPTEGVWDADFHLKEKGTTAREVITGFVKRVHEHTQKHQVPLSLDIFGVVAWRHGPDMDSTGQDIRMLAPHVEALSPMVYPSHFAVGFQGYEKPGDHPDIVAIGTKKAVEEVEAIGAKTVIRPWVQAFPFRTTSFGTGYVREQMIEAKKGGGVGWLAWNSGGEYGATLAAVTGLKK